MKKFFGNSISTCALLAVFASSCWATPITVHMSGKVTQQERFLPGVPPGTPWTINITFDVLHVAKIREIPSYNATYYVNLLSGEYSLGAGTSPLDDLWIVVFDNSVGGGDEVDFSPGYQQMTQLVVGLNDTSGHAITSLAFPDISFLTLSAFDNRLAHFDEDSPLVSGRPGGSYRQATVDFLSVTNVVSEPSSLTLSLAALLSIPALSPRGSVGRTKTQNTHT